MTAIDPHRSYLALEERLAATTDERQREVITVVLEHARLEAEPVWDVDRLMATLVAEPAYSIWVNGVDLGPKGVEAVRTYYDKMVRTRTNFFEIAVDRLVVDDEGVVTEGFVKQIYPGAQAARIGVPVDDPDADYLLVFRTIVLMPVNRSGLMEGEHIYISGPASATKLLPGDLPNAYTQLREAGS